MLKRMELWDFESHEHTVVDDLSEGLNLVCGESNSGKTSMVRALKLVAYNEFDPRSVRVGATKCKVLVETDKGTVKVTRGPKTNLWEVTPNGQPTQYFDKVGKDVVPAAAAVMGMKSVTLGDMNVPVNIMDQLESHFMLAGVGSEKATGSLRAQIVDEISGLSGIEGLIKAVSLDNYRFGREVKETEDEMEETRKQMHDGAALDAEESTLSSADALIKEHDDLSDAVMSGEGLLNEMQTLKEEVEAKEVSLAAIPDLDEASRLLDEADVTNERADKAGELVREVQVAEERIDELQKSLAGIPDAEGAESVLKEAEVLAARAAAAEVLWGEVETVRARSKGLEDRSKELEGLDKVDGLLEEAGRSLEKVDRATALYREVSEARALVDTKASELQLAEEGLAEAERERDEILASVTTCPLTLRPVSKECMEAK